MSASGNGISRYRAKKTGVRCSKIGRDGGGKRMAKRGVWWEVQRVQANGIPTTVHGRSGKKQQGWVTPTETTAAG